MWFVGFCYKCGKPVGFRKGQKTVLCRWCLKTLKCEKVLKNRHVQVKTGNEVAAVIQAINEGRLDIP